MGSYLDIIYCIILFAFVIYNAILIYRNYKREEAFGAGYSKIVNTLGTIFLLIGFIFITSYTVVIVPLILTFVFYLLFLILLKRHNQTHCQRRNKKCLKRRPQNDPNAGNTYAG